MAPALSNQQILYRSPPHEYPTEDNFEFAHGEAPGEVEVTGSDDVLVQLLYLSVDPYLRARMNPGPSYFPPFELGKV